MAAAAFTTPEPPPETKAKHIAKPKPKPTVLFISGGMNNSLPWIPLINALYGQGFTTMAVDLPWILTSGFLGPDVSSIGAYLEPMIEEKGQEVIVVLHSFSGGFPGSEALKGLGRRERAANGVKGGGGVVRLVYILSFQPPAHVIPPLFRYADKSPEFQTAQDIVNYWQYGVLPPPKDPKSWARQVQPPPVHAVSTHLPTTFVRCTVDGVVEIEYKDGMQDQIPPPSPPDEETIDRVTAGGFPFLHQVDGMVEIVNKAGKEADLDMAEPAPPPRLEDSKGQSLEKPGEEKEESATEPEGPSEEIKKPREETDPAVVEPVRPASPVDSNDKSLETKGEVAKHGEEVEKPEKGLDLKTRDEVDSESLAEPARPPTPVDSKNKSLERFAGEANTPAEQAEQHRNEAGLKAREEEEAEADKPETEVEKRGKEVEEPREEEVMVDKPGTEVEKHGKEVEEPREEEDQADQRGDEPEKRGKEVESPEEEADSGKAEQARPPSPPPPEDTDETLVAGGYLRLYNYDGDYEVVDVPYQPKKPPAEPEKPPAPLEEPAARHERTAAGPEMTAAGPEMTAAGPERPAARPQEHSNSRKESSAGGYRLLSNTQAIENIMQASGNDVDPDTAKGMGKLGLGGFSILASAGALFSNMWKKGSKS